MKKTVHYVRHFEALHNIQPNNFNIHDPELSSAGVSQAVDTIAVFKDIPTIDLIVCSPLIRTLQTYQLVFDGTPRVPPLIIHPDLQEVCSEPCDTGTPLEKLKAKFPSLLGELETFGETFGDEEWLEKKNPQSKYARARVQERANRFQQWLMARPEQNIVVISHSLMLIELFRIDGTPIEFRNGEVKSVVYD